MLDFIARKFEEGGQEIMSAITFVLFLSLVIIIERVSIKQPSNRSGEHGGVGRRIDRLQPLLAFRRGRPDRFQHRIPPRSRRETFFQTIGPPPHGSGFHRFDPQAWEHSFEMADHRRGIQGLLRRAAFRKGGDDASP